MSDVLGSGIAFPLTVDRRGSLALAAGERDVEEAITIILGTAPGERPMRPEFGCGAHDYVFETIDAYTLGRIEYEVQVALDRWEPRIDVAAIEFDLDHVAEGRLFIDITYSLRGTNDVRNLVYPFYVIPAEDGA